MPNYLRFVKQIAVILMLLIASLADAADDGAIIAALTGARSLRKMEDGYQVVSTGGSWLRAVRTADGGYCIFSTNGSSRVFRTPIGFGYNGPSNDYRTITVTPRGFLIQSASNTMDMVKVGSAWLDRESTNNFRILYTADGLSAVSGPMAPMPADTAYQLFQQHQQSEITPSVTPALPNQTSAGQTAPADARLFPLQLPSVSVPNAPAAYTDRNRR